jgi:small subunit ribosomal protein S21|tara:strand:+ start:317 stop:589 length:273 start_codon:yes stop_codon:yes gene_type:complete
MAIIEKKKYMKAWEKNTFGLKVVLDDKMFFDKALRIFKRKVDNSGLLRELKERGEYSKPSEKRKLAKGRAKKRWAKKFEQTHLAGRAKKY